MYFSSLVLSVLLDPDFDRISLCVNDIRVLLCKAGKKNYTRNECSSDVSILVTLRDTVERVSSLVSSVVYFFTRFECSLLLHSFRV